MGKNTEAERIQIFQSTTAELSNLIQQKNYSEANRFYYYHSHNRPKFDEILRRYIPPPTTCQVCGGPIPFEVSDCCNYWQHPCQVCERKRIMGWVASNLTDIQRARGVPQRFWNASLLDFPRSFQKFDLSKGLFASGPRGVGKTHFLCAIFRQYVLTMEPPQYTSERTLHPTYYDFRQDQFGSDFPKFISAPEFLLRVRGTFGNKELCENDVVEQYSDPKVLFLDDLGAEGSSDWAAGMLYLLINRRYENNLQTFISSNFDLKEMATRLDDRISSRISEMCEWVNMTGPDRRLQR